MRPTSAVPRKPVKPPPGETWRDVLATGYQVSDQGRVRNAGGRVLVLQAAGNPKAGRPYLRAELRCAGQRVRAFVHTLVALAFLGDPPPGMHVHHVNGNGRDNRAANLRYVPAHEHLSDHWRGERNRVAALTASDVHTILSQTYRRKYWQTYCSCAPECATCKRTSSTCAPSPNPSCAPGRLACAAVRPRRIDQCPTMTTGRTH